MLKIQFIYNILKSTFLSPRGTISSKRLAGFLMITEGGFLIAYAVFMKLHFGKTLDDYLVNLINTLLLTGSGLLGATIFEKQFKNNKNDKKYFDNFDKPIEKTNNEQYENTKFRKYL